MLDELDVENARRRVKLGLHEPAPPESRLSRRRLVVAVSAALFALTFGARLAIDDPNALVANFYTVPIAMLAIEFGLRGGLAAAVVAFGLVLAWSLVNTVQVGELGYASRAAAFVLVGGVVGRFADRLRADIAARQRAQRELAIYADELEQANGQLRQSVLRLEAFAEIARAVGGETDLRRVLQLILEHGQAILEARPLLVFLREGDELVLAAGSIVDGVPHSVAIAGRPTVQLADLGIAAGAGVLVPLVFHGESLGVLVALDQPGAKSGFSSLDAELLQTVGASTATAVMTAKSVARERLRDSIDAAEQARGRWARELHDDTLQGLGGLGMLLSSALAAGDDAVLRRAAGQAVEQTASEIRSLRGLIAELRPAALDDLGLAPAIETLAQRSARAPGLRVQTELELREDAVRLPPETESTVYRLVQEALTNVVKHAGAHEVLVRLTERDGGIEILVRDDGRGFDPGAPSDGFGLVGMRERVTLAGGRLHVASCSGGPTTVSAWCPVAETIPA